MSSSQALARWTPPWTPPATDGTVTVQENSHPEGGRWALFQNAFLSPSPGRTLDQVYTAAGKVMETQANRIAYKFGLGPHGATAGASWKNPPKLKKWCSKLVKYSLPTESANTQRQAFKEIVDLVTLFPGLRVLFLQTKVLDNTTSPDAMSKLWNRAIGPPDQEWTFWQILGAICLTDTTISAILESRSVSELTNCSQEGLSVIESLLVGQNCAALCLRYLTGILNLPGFWLNLGREHAQVAHKLCCRMVCVLKDIGVDIPSLGLIEEAPVDYDGVGLLATTLLDGLSSWFHKVDRDDWAMQPYCCGSHELQNCCHVHLPLPLPPLKIFCPLAIKLGQNTVQGDQATPAANHSTHNLSSHSIDSDHDANQESSEQGIESLDDSQSQTSNLSSDRLSLQDEESRNSDSSNPMLNDTDGNVLGDLSNGTTGMPGISGAQALLVSTSWPSLEARCKDLEEWKLILFNKQRDLGDNHPETLDAIESLAWLHHELGEYRSARDLRVAVLEKYHTLLGISIPGAGSKWSMRSLAGIYRQLDQLTEAEDLYHIVVERGISILGLGTTYLVSGQLKKAEDLLTVVFEKQKTIFGEEHPDTLHTMGYLASTYNHLGQLGAAEKLATVTLEKHQKVYGKNHPQTAWIMDQLALIFQQQGQLERAEEHLVTVLEKRRKLLGDDHPHTRWTMNVLVNLYRSMVKLQAAEELERLIGDQEV
ncbi:hypothetical protein B0H14DRAFT_3156759 [Mycena olivaceomarginata]|nr:hypothetical protein B0H14DRAFT_3156759 [Mycena olivaceomarginata]